MAYRCFDHIETQLVSKFKNVGRRKKLLEAVKLQIVLIKLNTRHTETGLSKQT